MSNDQLTAAIATVRAALATATGTGAGVQWRPLASAMSTVCGTETPDTEALLDEVLAFDGEIRLADDSALPHALPPREYLQAHAVETLNRWGKGAATVKLQQLHGAAESQVLRGLVQAQITAKRSPIE